MKQSNRNQKLKDRRLLNEIAQLTKDEYLKNRS